MRTMHYRLVGAPLLLTIYLSTTASLCQPNLTPTQTIQNVAFKVEQFSDLIVVNAQQLAVSNPTVMTLQRRVAVDLAGDKIGRLGADLGTAIDSYNAIKAAHGDLTAQAATINSILNAITDSLNTLSLTLPRGTVASIEQAVVQIFSLVATVKASL